MHIHSYPFCRVKYWLKSLETAYFELKVLKVIDPKLGTSVIYLPKSPYSLNKLKTVIDIKKTLHTLVPFREYNP